MREGCQQTEGLDGEEKKTQRNATKWLRSVRRYTRLTPHLVVSRDDFGDPSLSGRSQSSGGDSNRGRQGRPDSDFFMRTGDKTL